MSYRHELGPPRSLLFGLPALLAALLLLACRCWVRLRDRRGAEGRDSGPELQESRCFAAAFGGLDAGSFKTDTGTVCERQHEKLCNNQTCE